MVSDWKVTNILKTKTCRNLHMWDFELKILFRAKNLMGIVDGSEKLSEDEDTKKIELWKSKDAKAQYMILQTIEHSVKLHIVTCETSKDMYDTLKTIYKRDSSQQKCSLLQDFYNY